MHDMFSITKKTFKEMGTEKRLILSIILCSLFVVSTAALVLVHAFKATNLSDCNITLSTEKSPFSGKLICPEVTIDHNNKTLKKGADYEIEYANNLNPGIADITIAGKGDYIGVAHKKFSIFVDPVKNLSAKETDTKGSNSLHLEWDPSKCCSYYEIKISNDLGKVFTDKSKKNTYTFDQIEKFADYNIVVYAVGGKKKTRSAGVDASIQTNPLKKPTIKVSDAGCRSIQVSWNSVADASKYKIDETSSSGEKNSITVSKDELANKDEPALILDEKSSGATYTYTVSALAESNGKQYEGPASNKDSATAPAPRIGEATIGETGNGSGNRLGDQTGGEVGISKWAYSGSSSSHMNYTYLFRFKDPDKARVAAQTMEDCCNNDHVGYDNGTSKTRLSLYREAIDHNWDCSAINSNCATACSQLVAVCVNSAGVSAKADVNAQMLYDNLKNFSDFEIFSDSAHVASPDNLKRGDILITVHSNGKHNHACMVL